MSINFGIYWLSRTHECTLQEPIQEPIQEPMQELQILQSRQINSDDPNELFETGFRNNTNPFPETIPDEEKYKLLHQKLFTNGPKLKFVASDKFVGSLFGYVFYMGNKGLGYYLDPLIMRHVFFKS
jgi:hypothetical protein